MERYHMFKLGLAILFYAAYCVRPMLVTGLRSSHLVTNQTLRPEDYFVFYQGVDGTPGVDFPVLSYIPKTTFSCDGIDSGYYADLDTDCQVFHICEEGKKISFLCPNGTIFEQEDLICEWWYKVNCTNAPNLYQESAEFLRDDLARRKASRRVSHEEQARRHGAVMRVEESASVTAKQNGKPYQVKTSGANNNLVQSKNLPHKRYNDADTGNFINNDVDEELSGERSSRVYVRSTTPSSLGGISSNSAEIPTRKQTKLHRGSIKFSSSFSSGKTTEAPASTLKTGVDEYDLEFPKHKSEVGKATKADIDSSRITLGAKKPQSDSEEVQVPQETAAFAQNSYNSLQGTRKFPTSNAHPNHRPTYSDLKRPDLSSTRIVNTINSVTPQYITTQPINKGKPFIGSTVGVRNLGKAQTERSVPGFGGPKAVLSLPGISPLVVDGDQGFSSTLLPPELPSSYGGDDQGISSTLQPPFSSTFFDNTQGFSSTPQPFASTQGFFPTVQPEVPTTTYFDNNVGFSSTPWSSTPQPERFASTPQPGFSSTAFPLADASTGRTIDQATVYGSYSKATTVAPRGGVQVKFGKNVDKVAVQLSKSLGGDSSSTTEPQLRLATDGYVRISGSISQPGAGTGLSQASVILPGSTLITGSIGSAVTGSTQNDVTSTESSVNTAAPNVHALTEFSDNTVVPNAQGTLVTVDVPPPVSVSSVISGSSVTAAVLAPNAAFTGSQRDSSERQYIPTTSIRPDNESKTTENRQYIPTISTIKPVIVTSTRSQVTELLPLPGPTEGVVTRNATDSHLNSYRRPNFYPTPSKSTFQTTTTPNFRVTSFYPTTFAPPPVTPSPATNTGFFVTRNGASGTTFGISKTPAVSKAQYQGENTLTRSESKWPRPFQKSLNAIDGGLSAQKPNTVTPTYLTYKISSARPFELSKTTPAPTIPTPFTTARSVQESVDSMINALKEVVGGHDYSSETPRPGLVVPPSVGPQTLHTLAQYFANALDGIVAEKEKETGQELDEESKEKLTSLLTEMTMYRYKQLFQNQASGEEVTEVSTTTGNVVEELQGDDSNNLVETPELRQLALNFSRALSSYLNDPDAFKKELETLRPTEPPALGEVETEVPEELLNFSDADSQPVPVFPSPQSPSPTWGYIIASKPSEVQDIKNSLNPDLHTADTQSFVPGFNSLPVDKVESSTGKALPGDHWTASPGVTKLWQSALSVNPAVVNENLDSSSTAGSVFYGTTTTEAYDATTLPPPLDLPQSEIHYDLRSLPPVSLNSTQVHGILIDFVNTTKTDESNRLQRLLRKLNTTEDEFLNRMKEIENNPLTKRLILLLISECGANVSKDLHRDLVQSFEASSSNNVVTAAGVESRTVSNSDIPALVDPSLQSDDQDTRALQLLNSLYAIASKFGK